MRHHIEHAEDGPVCRKCGKPMKPETVFKGIGVKSHGVAPDAMSGFPLEARISPQGWLVVILSEKNSKGKDQRSKLDSWTYSSDL